MEEAATNPGTEVAIEQATVAEAPEAVETVSEVEATESQEAEVVETADDGDEVEVEFEGKAYKLPKELKDALLRQADYTKKTQEVAMTRKEIAAERERVAAEIEGQRKSVEAQRANVRAYADLHAIDARLAEHSKTDWQALSAQDPIEAQQKFIEFSQLRDKRAQVAGWIANQERTVQIQAQQEHAKRLEEGRKVLERDIKGWSPEVASKVRDFGLANGYSEKAIDAMTDPVAIKVLHKAMLYDQLAKTMIAKPKEPEVAVVPPKKISGGTVVAKDPDKMTTKEWLNWRNNQLSKKSA